MDPECLSIRIGRPAADAVKSAMCFVLSRLVLLCWLCEGESEGGFAQALWTSSYACRRRLTNNANSHHIVDNKVKPPASRLKVQVRVMHSNCLCTQITPQKLQSHEIHQAIL